MWVPRDRELILKSRRRGFDPRVMLTSPTQVAFRLFGQLVAALLGLVALVLRAVTWVVTLGGATRSRRVAKPRADAEIFEDVEFLEDDEEPADDAPIDEEVDVTAT